MEEVLEKLGTTIITKKAEEKNEFEALYKNWGKLGNQEERRREILEVQKSNRNTKIDKVRGILEMVQTTEYNNVYHSYRNYYRPNIYVAGFNRTSPTYSNVLMMSEWMVEKPMDFNENWLVVPCPKGVRMLVVAFNGSTKFYSKYGHFSYECRTALPGGNPCAGKKRNGSLSVFDGFYVEKNNTFYILDVLAWNIQAMTDGETEFRHYWLKTQFSELPNLRYINKRNEVIFSLLPMTPCTPNEFQEFMLKYPHFECNFPTLDGLLFYHKNAHYFSGETPLVGWLFPYMVPEVLGQDIKIHEVYAAQKPANYVSQIDFIQKFEAKYAKNKRRNRTSSYSSIMDTSDENTDKTKTDKSAKTDSTEMSTDPKETVTVGTEITTDVTEMATDVKEVATDDKEIAADVKEMTTDVKEMTADVKVESKEGKATESETMEAEEIESSKEFRKE